MTKIDEQQRELEKQSEKNITEKLKLESDFDDERSRHSKEIKVLTDRLDYATNLVRLISLNFSLETDTVIKLSSLQSEENMSS